MLSSGGLLRGSARSHAAAWIGVTAVFFQLSCSRALDDLGYYLHLARGQLTVVLGCEDVASLLEAETLPSQTRDRLLFIAAVRRFGFDRLGLASSDNYSCFFDTHGQPISWNVSACPPHRLQPFQWRFPIVGAVPYKGFFNRERALAERDSLRSRGYDVVVRPVSAYSTLGFFSDPVLSTMLDYSEAEVADLILHELTHSTIYAKGHTDFNESLATFVGATGSLQLLSDLGGADGDAVSDARARRSDRERFRQFMKSVVAALDSLYHLDLPRDQTLQRRVDVFASWQENFRSTLAGYSAPERYRHFQDWEINNARLLSYRRYHGRQEQFSELYRLTGSSMRQSLVLIKSCERASDPWACVSDSVASRRRVIEQRNPE